MTTFRPGDDTSEDRCQPITRVFIAFDRTTRQYRVTTSPHVARGDVLMANGATFPAEQAQRFVAHFNGTKRMDGDIATFSGEQAPALRGQETGAEALTGAAA